MWVFTPALDFYRSLSDSMSRTRLRIPTFPKIRLGWFLFFLWFLHLLVFFSPRFWGLFHVYQLVLILPLNSCSVDFLVFFFKCPSISQCFRFLSGSICGPSKRKNPLCGKLYFFVNKKLGLTFWSRLCDPFGSEKSTDESHSLGRIKLSG